MGLETNITRRGLTYQLRIEVPLDVREAFGKAVVRESLHTRIDREARHRGATRKAELLAEWEDLRKRRAATPEDHQKIAVEFLESELAHDRRFRAALPTSQEIDQATGDGLDQLALRNAAAYDRDRRKALLATLRQHVAEGENALVTWAADQAIQERQLLIKPGSQEYRELCQTIERVWIAALEMLEKRDAGDWSAKPADDVVKPVATQSAIPVAAPGESIMEMFEAYALANPRNVKSDTLAYGRQCVRLFAETLPARFPASAITKAHVREWADLLNRHPVKAAEITQLRGLDMRAAIKKNEKLRRPTLSRKSVNKYLAALASFCSWLDRRGQIDGNPVNGLHLTIDKDAQPVRSYTPEELQKIFTSPIFTGYLSNEKDHLPGNMTIRDWRFWLPLIALFSGARMGEIAQLQTDNLRNEHSTWIFLITDGDGKSVKTKSARRVVPVHPELIKIGLLDYHAALAARGERRLFPEIELDARGQISGYPSRWFGRYTKRIGVKDGKATNFHSFRHGMADAFRRAGYLDAQFGFMLGHSNQRTGVTRGYGVLSEGNLTSRVAMIEAVSFPSLDLSYLYSKRV